MSNVLRHIIEVLHLELLFQLGLATLCGGLIGLERELSGKPAGLRTNILICVGATLFTSLSVELSLGRGDPARVAAQVLPGIGFIGAGAILHTRGSVTGLTSAATIWVNAAIGMALGTHAYVEAIGAMLLVTLVLAGLGRAERLLGQRQTQMHLLVHARPEPTALAELEALIERSGLEVERTVSRQENVDLVIEFDLRGSKRLHNEVLANIVHHPSVRTVSTGE